MRYIEYKAEIKHGFFNERTAEVKLGLLGENHTYTQRESEFARDLVHQYWNVAVEGSNTPPKSLLPLVLTYLAQTPIRRGYYAATNRSKRIATAHKLAKEIFRNVIRLDDTHLIDPKLRTQIGIMSAGLIYTLALPLAPITYSASRIYYHIKGDIRVESVKNKGVEGITDEPTMKIRDEHMARTSFEILKERKNDLLVVCGEAHLEGIVENLTRNPNLKLRKTINQVVES